MGRKENRTAREYIPTGIDSPALLGNEKALIKTGDCEVTNMNQFEMRTRLCNK